MMTSLEKKIAISFVFILCYIDVEIEKIFEK
jgi:hypothetical protein